MQVAIVFLLAAPVFVLAGEGVRRVIERMLRADRPVLTTAEPARATGQPLSIVG
jgi:hypothetical protein